MTRFQVLLNTEEVYHQVETETQFTHSQFILSGLCGLFCVICCCLKSFAARGAAAAVTLSRIRVPLVDSRAVRRSERRSSLAVMRHDAASGLVSVSPRATQSPIKQNAFAITLLSITVKNRPKRKLKRTKSTFPLGSSVAPNGYC